ncbi:hypothetical protein KRR38_00355 [Novosphingobium sp. G106]|uniref:hypothetical protein n=1 Tax=Novosphingobium sp. G106 TaxID=2849500 RepID=UPI001C2CCFEE|nr:hypothetical protein [Novosphingobium sp. G106]MBV1686162.1 hypothetical protein [Novosphingobium sp. G106]
MKSIAQYAGNLLNHVEALYRPGERELAIELVEALGCAVTDTGFKGDGVDTFLAVHPNPDDRNPNNNVFYISQIRSNQLAVEERLRRLNEEDSEFAALLENYRQEACTKPFGIPHFALRYPSSQDVDDVSKRINASLKHRLKDRLHLRIFRPGDADAAVCSLTQGFLFQDVIVSGSFLMGQLIELQTQS